MANGCQRGSLSSSRDCVQGQGVCRERTLSAGKGRVRQFAAASRPNARLPGNPLVDSFFPTGDAGGWRCCRRVARRDRTAAEIETLPCMNQLCELRLACLRETTNRAAVNRPFHPCKLG